MTTDKPDLPDVDAQIDTILRASGSAFRHYTMQSSKDRLRQAMRRVLADERRKARAELIAERDAAFNRGMFVAAGIVVSAFDQPTIAAEIIRSVGDAAVKDADEYDAGVLAPHFPQFAPYAPKE